MTQCLLNTIKPLHSVLMNSQQLSLPVKPNKTHLYMIGPITISIYRGWGGGGAHEAPPLTEGSWEKQKISK